MRTMPFGKHKGESLRDIPYDYLSWVLDNCTRIDRWLRAAIRQELDRRLDDDGDPEPAYPPPADLQNVVRAWYRRLVLKYHPDRGGSHEAMKAINDAHEQLKQLVGLN
jgi:hypothetical protein